MHTNTKMLQHLYSSLNRHDYAAMAACYHPDATFRDIAFDLKGADQIRAMWHMICKGDIRTTFEVVRADDREGVVRLVDKYTFSDTGRKMRNSIESRFRFEKGLIIEHHDFCDPKAWAAAALGGFRGYIAGRVHFFRAWKARRKLDKFIHDQGNPYRAEQSKSAGLGI